MTPLQATRGLVTVALLKAQFDQGRDYIGMFLPFVLDAVRHMNVTNADAEMIKMAIVDRHGFAIPIPTLRTLLKRARRHGIARQGGRYFFSKSDLPDAGIERRAGALEGEHHALAQAFIKFAKSEGHTLETIDSALALLFTFVAQNEVALLLDDSPAVLVRELDKPGRQESHLTARFLLHVALSDPTLTSYIEHLLEGFVLQNTLLLSDINSLRTRYDKLSVYFDSGILLGALGLLGKPSEIMYRELIDLLRHSGARLGVLDVTMSEIGRILDVYVAKLLTNQGRRSLRPTLLTRHVLTNRLTAADLKQIRVLLDHRLRNLHVFPTDRPKHIREYTLDEKDLSQRLSGHGGIENTVHEPRVVHDVDCVAAILTLRRGRVANDFSKSQAVFVTDSREVLETVRKWYRDQDLGGVDPVVHWNTISNLAWLKQPAFATNFKVNQLTALCGAALSPDRKTWQRFLDHLNKLEEEGELDSDEAVAILVSALTEESLLDLEDDGGSDSDSVDEVVERVRRSYAKQSEEQIGMAKKETRVSDQRLREMQHHNATVSDAVARTGSWIIIGMAGLGVMLSAVYFASFTANVITVVTLVSGVSLLGLRRWIERALSSWLQRLLKGPTIAGNSDAKQEMR